MNKLNVDKQHLRLTTATHKALCGLITFDNKRFRRSNTQNTCVLCIYALKNKIQL